VVVVGVMAVGVFVTGLLFGWSWSFSFRGSSLVDSELVSRIRVNRVFLGRARPTTAVFNRPQICFWSRSEQPRASSQQSTISIHHHSYSNPLRISTWFPREQTNNKTCEFEVIDVFSIGLIDVFVCKFHHDNTDKS
jgi:hypothetical protein